MQFLQPQWLNLLWLGLIPVTLYLFRRKAKRIPVSTLLFFRSLAREHQESAWLRRLKRLLSLLLTLLVLLFAILALSRPYREAGGDVPRSLVVMLDRSASMAATDAGGKSRLDVARELLRERLRSLPDNVITSLLVYDSRLDMLQSRSTNRRELLRMIDGVEVLPVEDRPEAALTAAERMAALDAPAEIWHVSDRPLTTAVGENVRYRFMDVAMQKAVNAGITAFQIRPAPMARNRYEAFVEVSASASNAAPANVTLETRLDGRPIQLRELELASGESRRLVLPLDGGRGQSLEMELRLPGDSLAWDNMVMAPLPEIKPLVIAWFAESPDPFTELALTSLLAEDRIQVLKGGGKDWPIKDKPDLYVFENWLPDDWPQDRPALVLNPPQSVGPVLARKLDQPLPHDTVRAVQPDHPVLFRVTNTRVAITQTSVLNVSDTLETLWMAGNEPVLTAGEANGQRLVITAFQPSKSEQLALLPAFPLLVGNAIYWCVENNASEQNFRTWHTGETVPVKTPSVKWHVWDGSAISETTEEPRSGWLSLDKVGTFEMGDGTVASSLLLSSRETNLSEISKVENNESTAEERWAVGGSWWAVFLWAVLGVLLLESWLFHREAVY